MNRWSIPELPERSGAYRWLYVDASCKDFTAVAIFMVGSVFSARYAGALTQGAHPLAHCAVNFALYRQGQRVAWVLSEYPGARQETGTLGIGRSTFTYLPEGRLEVDIHERTTPWGAPVRARLRLTPEGPPADELTLFPGASHRWQLRMGRARATLELPEQSAVLEGWGYHDTNHGDVRLGADLPGWSWTRLHGPNSSKVSYRVPGRPTLQVCTWDGGLLCWNEEERALPTRVTGWGLRVPTELRALHHGLEAHTLLESSPFYARLEAKAEGLHALGEVADFRRFHSPWVRWMAHFRTRVERQEAA